MHSSGCVGSPPRPALDLAEIFRAHGETFRQRHRLTLDQRRAMRAIELCRTAALGGHLDYCVHCRYERPAYNSCRNRHCPKCQALAQARWIDARKDHILPVPHFHVVFTLPAELRPLARLNRARVFNLLFATVAATLAELARDPKRLGATLGFTAVLHTWTRDLRFHPHLHCVVTAGGLAPSGDAWIPGSHLGSSSLCAFSRVFSAASSSPNCVGRIDGSPSPSRPPSPMPGIGCSIG